MQMKSDISLLFKVQNPGFHIPEKHPQIPEVLKYDLTNFLRVNQSLSPRETAQAFRAKWGGYKAKYSEEFITEAVKWLSK